MDGERVTIIGAGTAGLLAAKKLGNYGIDTTVYDQKTVLGHPVRASGILSITGLSTLGMDYSSLITNTLYGANLHADGKTMRIVSKEPMAYILDREKLNHKCRDDAVGAGAKVITGKRISGQDLASFSNYGILIGSDGAVSSVARHFSLGEIERVALTYKADFNVDVPDSRMVDLFFDRDHYRGLFAWLAPNAKDVLEVGIGVDSRYGNGKKAFEHFMKSREVRDIVGDRKPMTEGASIIPMSLRRRIVDEKRRVMLVGDAAGQVKPTTGGGIIFGGNAAIMAADTVNRHLKGSARLSEYETLFRKRFGFDLKLHSLTNGLYSAMSAKTTGRIINAMNFLGVDKFLGTYGDMDRPSLILKRFFLRSLV